MKRREFIRTGCFAGIAIAGSCLILDSCKMTSAVREENGQAVVPLSEFKNKNVVVFNSAKLLQNVIVTKESDTTYKAFLMKCTHKGASLEYTDGILLCPAHGSIFDLQGNVKSAPAQKPLKSFPVTVNATELIVQLL